MDHLPQLTVYNKMDERHPDFVPTSENHIMISALREDDRQILKQKIEEEAINIMVPYHVLIPSTEGKLLAQLKIDTILRELLFQEDEQVYKCKGFALADHPVFGQLEQFQQ